MIVPLNACKTLQRDLIDIIGERMDQANISGQHELVDTVNRCCSASILDAERRQIESVLAVLEGDEIAILRQDGNS